MIPWDAYLVFLIAAAIPAVFIFLVYRWLKSK